MHNPPPKNYSDEMHFEKREYADDDKNEKSKK